MATTHTAQEIPGRVLFSEGNGDLSRLEINTAWSNAEVYLHGAHITHFQEKSGPPILFLSQLSRFNVGTAIREVAQSPTGSVCLRLTLPDSPSAALFPKFSATYSMTIGKTLAAELTVVNLSQDQDFTYEDCLHSYFNVGDISAVSITGLKGIDYLDKTENFARKTERAEHIKITQETDRIYLDTKSVVEIHDSSLQRRIRIEKSGSTSTVVWNPWVAKAQQMPDFGNDEYLKMVCVESGNVADNRVTLPAGKSASLRIEISTLPL
jgi:glucose-6-phosphate 1-epimerase